MSEYDLRTRRALRQVTLLEFGFGPESMQRCKLCPECGRANPAQDTHCTDCGAVLPEKTLYDFYLSRHRCCPGCGVAVTFLWRAAGSPAGNGGSRGSAVAEAGCYD